MPRTTSKRDDIIAAAAALIRGKGVHAASIKAIIDASGASAGTIYHHFKNKNDIVLAVAQHAIAEPITTILTRPRSGPLSPGLLFREVSEAVLGGHIDSALIVQLWAGSSTDPELNAMLHGLMVADRVLHDGGLRESMSRLVGEMRNYPGIETAAWALTHADGRSESPVETIGRYAFLEAGLTPPLSNVWITDGRSVRRVDHLLADDGIVLECDGDVKYSGPDAAAVIDDEKSRERWLRALGLSVIRYGYRRAVYARGGILAEVARERRARAGRPAPQCWSLDNPLAA